MEGMGVRDLADADGRMDGIGAGWAEQNVPKGFGYWGQSQACPYGFCLAGQEASRRLAGGQQVLGWRAGGLQG